MHRAPVGETRILGVVRGRRAIERPFETGDARIVHQHVEGGEAFGHRVPVRFGGYVEPSETRADLVGRRLARIGIDVGQDHGSTFVAKGASNGGSDPARAPCHQSGLVP